MKLKNITSRMPWLCIKPSCRNQMLANCCRDMTSIRLCCAFLLYTLIQAQDPVCFDNLGCFSQKPPHVTPNRPFPKPHTPEVINLQMFLYERDTESRQIYSNETINFQKPTYVLIHGSNCNSSYPKIQELRQAILINRDANVLVVDWGGAAESGPYSKVAATLPVVGSLIGNFVLDLMENQLPNETEKTRGEGRGEDWTTIEYARNYMSFGKISKRMNHKRLRNLQAMADQVHIIGQSVGAHICGFTGRHIIQTSKVKVRSIYALDPTQRYFEFYEPELSILKTDARIVIVTHTSGRLYVPYWGYGYIRPLGHIDFFINGGKNQKPCPEPKTKEDFLLITKPEQIDEVTHEQAQKFGLCPHNIAYDYLSFALNQTECQFIGTGITDEEIDRALQGLEENGERGEFEPQPVENCQNQGCLVFDLDTYKTEFRGGFYVAVKEETPFCEHKLPN